MGTSMKRYLLPLVFMAIGIADFIYGIAKEDAISLGIGALLVGISLYIIRRESLTSSR